MKKKKSYTIQGSSDAWIPLEDETRRPDNFQPVFVLAAEYGKPYVPAICRFWQSDMENSEPKFYLDRDSYGLDYNSDVGTLVKFWMPVPLPLEVKQVEMF